jgi:inosine/xanthosine triphosphatase
MDIVVASQNPVKIEAVRGAFESTFSGQTMTFRGVSAASGVADQPMGDAETLQGARNRAESAAASVPEAAYTVGVEGGCAVEDDHQLSVFAWVVVRARDGRTGISKTGVFYLPLEVAQLVADGMELGHADDVVFGRENSKQDTGSVGLLTGDVVTRRSYYQQAVVLALIPFLNPGLTFKG